MDALRALDQTGDYDRLIETLRALIREDRRILTDAWVKEWCGRRWRNIFIAEMADDNDAVAAASSRKDSRPIAQRVAERFLRGEGRNEWQANMPGADTPDRLTTTLIFCPGLLTGLLPTRAFQEAFPEIEDEHGWHILRADSHPMRSCNDNQADLLNAIEHGVGLSAGLQKVEAPDAKPPGDIVLMGYSKGVPDLLTLLANRPDLASRIRSIINWAGAPGGSYLANDIYNSIEPLKIDRVEGVLTRMLTVINPLVSIPSPYNRMAEFDVKGAVRDLTTDVRSAFSAKNGDALDVSNIPIFNLTGSTTMTEVPYFQIQGVLELNKYDANNDMQVTQDQAKISLPMATDLAMLRGHHWDLSYTAFPKSMRFGSPNLDHPFPKKPAAMAIFKFLAELGLID